MFEDNDEFENEMDDWIDEALKRGEGFQDDEERQAYLDSLGDPLKHPLFSQDEEELKNHPLTEAFRLLREEDKTLCELAAMYKDDGNEYMKKKKPATSSSKITTSSSATAANKVLVKDMNEAYDRYSHAITFIQQAKIARMKCEEDMKDAHIDLNLFHSTLLSNRAQASLNIKNYRYCISDCIHAIKYYHMNIKAYYRQAKASYMLKKYYNAMMICRQGLEIEPHHQDLIIIRDEIQQELDRISHHHEQMMMMNNEKRTRWDDVYDLIMNRLGAKLSYPLNPTDPYPVLKREYYPKMMIDDKNLMITLPLMILYPEYGEHDMIEAANIDDMIIEHVMMMFPDISGGDNNILSWAPWDRKHEYHTSSIIIYLPLHISPMIDDHDVWMECYDELSIILGIKPPDHDGKDDPDMILSQVQQRYHDRIAKHEHMKSSSSTSSYVIEVDIQGGYDISSLIHMSGCVLPGGVLTMLAFARDNDAHKQYKRIQQSLGVEFITVDAYKLR